MSQGRTALQILRFVTRFYIELYKPHSIKVSYKMTLLGKLRKYLNNEVALLLYKSMILPYFDYADVIFHRANVKETGRLQILQNKCLRICLSKDRRFSKSGSHKLADTAFLKDRREPHVNNFMYVRRGNKSLLNNRESRTRAHNATLFDVVVFLKKK